MRRRVSLAEISRILVLVTLVLGPSRVICPARPAGELCESTPEEQGMDSKALATGLEEIAVESKGLQSLLVVRHGCLVLETYRPPYGRDQKHYLNSATKSVLSGLVGIAIQEGRLREDDRVLSFFPDFMATEQDARKKQITIKQLLTMSSGISWPQTATGENASVDMGKSSDWARFILDRPMAAEPGGVINYSNGDSHLMAAILQKATGSTALEFARENLFGPLGIEDVAWDTDPQGRNIGSAALKMRPVDMAKFGLLYLHGGKAGGRPVVPLGWVKRSLTPQVKMPTKGGPADYGYYWWLYPDQKLFEAWGGAGQRIGVFRELDLVVVMTADMPQDYPRSPFAAKMYETIQGSIRSTKPLPANPAAMSALKRSLAELTAP